MSSRSRVRRRAKRVPSANPSFTKLFKLLKWLFLAVVSIVLIIGVVAAFLFSREKKLSGGERYTFLVSSSPDTAPTLISYNLQQKTASVIEFPNELMVPTVYGYGEYQISALKRLGELEKLDSLLLQKSLQELTGLYINDVFFTDVNETASFPWNTAIEKQLFFSLLNQMPLREAWDMSKTIYQGLLTPAQKHNLLQNGILVEEVRADNSRVYYVDKSKLDNLIKENFKNWSYAQEGIRIGVINTTEHFGLASQVVRSLNHNGIDVVVGNDNHLNLSKSTILLSSERLLDSKTVKLLQVLYDSFEIKVGDTQEYRADAVVLIGESYWDYLTKKPWK